MENHYTCQGKFTSDSSHGKRLYANAFSFKKTKDTRYFDNKDEKSISKTYLFCFFKMEEYKYDMYSTFAFISNDLYIHDPSTFFKDDTKSFSKIEM